MPKKHNVIVVGNGLFGSIAATLARSEGHEVTVVSEKRQYEASPASGCVLAPSWLSSLERSQVDEALSVLGSLYKVEDLEFRTNLLKTFKAQRVRTKDVLLKPDFEGKVVEVGNGYVKSPAGTVLRGTVLVCAGIWCRELLPDMPLIRGLYGASLRLPGQLTTPRINVYAPYRQAVGFNMDGKNVWFGDGSAYVQKTWEADEESRVQNTAGRLRDMLKQDGQKPQTFGTPKITVGARPYVEGYKAGYFQQVMPKTWVSTGGSKNGTVLAAWQALRFVKEALK